MKLPIRNRTATALTLFIEPYCDQYEIPPHGEAMVTLDDGEPHSLEVHPENWITLWNEGENCASVEIVSKEQNSVVDALAFARGWLCHYGLQGQAAAKELDEAVEGEEEKVGYLQARFAAYRAFREGFRAKALEDEPDNALLSDWRGSETLAAAYRAGGLGAYLNYRTRIAPGLIELGEPPFDTDVARRKFDEADAMIAPTGS